MNLASVKNHPRQRGVGLVEVMVGLLVGLITTIVIFQVVDVSTRTHRTVGGGVQAQAAGTLAIYALERDLQQAGFGLGRIAGDCLVAGRDGTGAPVTPFNLRPVSIVDGLAASDSMAVLVGSSPMVSQAVDYTGAVDPSAIDGNFLLGSRAGFDVNDVLIAVKAPIGPAQQCVLSQVNGPMPTGVNIRRISHGTGAGRFRPTAGFAFGATGSLYNLGPQPRLVRYAIDSTKRSLTTTSLLQAGAPAIDVARGIVDLQAQYGYDANGNGQIDAGEWVDVLPAAPDYGRLIAVRFALLDRSSELIQPTEALSPTPTWGGAAARAFISLTTDPDWNRYRYRVYESTVTLRNVLWGGA